MGSNAPPTSRHVIDIDLRSISITGVVCAFCFSVGLIFTTGAGEYWLKMFDSFAGTIGLVVVALMEMIAVIYIYGHEKYDMFFMFYILHIIYDSFSSSLEVHGRYLPNDWYSTGSLLANDLAIHWSSHHGLHSAVFYPFDATTESYIRCMEW